MALLRRRLILVTCGLAVLMFLVALGSFFLVREVTSDPIASAEPVAPPTPQPGTPVCGKTFGPGGEVESYCLPEPLEPWWYVPLVEQELLKPRADVVINGIHVGPNSVQPGGPCLKPDPGLPLEQRVRSADAAAGTELEISPSYLPPKTHLVYGEAGWCSAGESGLARVEKVFQVGADPNVMRFGGVLIIARVRGERYADSQIAIERLKAGTILGRPAVIGEPITKSGLGPSEVIIAEPFGVTIVRANGLTLDELIRIAEGLYR